METETSQAGAVRAFILEQFPLARQRQIKDEESLVESGIVDSLGVLEIVTFLETRFGLVLSDDDIVSENFVSIAAISRFIAARENPESPGMDI